jgi:ABC-type branched-subunit amino acid transport system substrate-binding protein
VEQDPQTALAHLNRGIDAHRDGDEESAQRHFAQALRLEPDNEVAWLWMSESSSVPAQQLYCLNRAVRINPDSRGRAHRDALRQAGVTATVPPAIRDLENPPLPPSYRPGAPALVLPVALRQRNRRSKTSPSSSTTDPDDGSPSGLAKPVVREDWHWLWLVIGSVLMFAAVVGIYWWVNNDDFTGEILDIALVGPMTGDNAWVGQELERGAGLAIESWNASNSDVHLRLVVFDDRNDPDLAAEIAQEIVAEGSIVAVVGHGTSAASIAAAPFYEAANLPVISPTATMNELSDYDTYFRTIFSDNTEATMISVYLTDVLGASRVTIINGETPYEVDLSNQFALALTEREGSIAGRYIIPSTNTPAGIADIIDQIERLDDPGMIFLATSESHGKEFLLALRRAGLTVPVFGSETMGSSEFAARFANEPEEQASPGFFTEGMYAASPLIYDAVGADAIRFSDTYTAEFGITPSWRPARTWDAISAFAFAARRGDVRNVAIEERRAAILHQLQRITSPETSFPGLSGDFYFTTDRDSPQSLSVGQFSSGIFSSAPTQYRLVANPDIYDIDAEVSAGRMIEMNGYFIRQYRVVYVGIEMIELRDLNTSDQNYFVDFFIYFRWDGDERPLNILFSNSSTARLGLGTPISEQVTDAGQNYRLYRVQGTFDEPMDFHEYPWDQHSLTIRMINPVLDQNDLVYVPDPVAMALSQQERQRSSMDLDRSFNRIPSWNVEKVIFAQDSITSTADDYDVESLVQYSEFQVIIDIGRDVDSFLAKNLLPLALLSLVTYIAIWFPAEQAGARVGFAITALLSSSVMLNTISGHLPEIGYTVAIEWGYYAYLWMSAILILLTIAVDRSYKAKRYARVRKLDTLIRTCYPLAILAVVAGYWWQFYR